MSSKEVTTTCNLFLSQFAVSLQIEQLPDELKAHIKKELARYYTWDGQDAEDHPAYHEAMEVLEKKLSGKLSIGLILESNGQLIYDCSLV